MTRIITYRYFEPVPFHFATCVLLVSQCQLSLFFLFYFFSINFVGVCEDVREFRDMVYSASGVCTSEHIKCLAFSLLLKKYVSPDDSVFAVN